MWQELNMRHEWRHPNMFTQMPRQNQQRLLRWPTKTSKVAALVEQFASLALRRRENDALVTETR